MSMVNKLSHEVNDVVTLADGTEGIIVDIVNNGEYRVKTDNGIATVREDEIKQKLMDTEIDASEEITEGKLMQYAKKFFKDMDEKKEGETLEEGLRAGDME